MFNFLITNCNKIIQVFSVSIYSTGRTIRRITTTTTTTSSGPIDDILPASLIDQYKSAEPTDFTHLTYSQSGGENVEQPSTANFGTNNELAGRESLQTIVTQFVEEERKQS